MYGILSIFCLGIFLLLSPVLLGYRLLRNKPRWWVIGLAVSLCGWAAWFGAAAFHFQHLHVLIEGQGELSEELMEEMASDGAPMVFALLFGWAFAAVYSIPWLVVYGLVALVPKGMNGSGRSRR